MNGGRNNMEGVRREGRVKVGSLVSVLEYLGGWWYHFLKQKRNENWKDRKECKFDLRHDHIKYLLDIQAERTGDNLK